MIGRLKCVRNGVKIFGRLSARVWSAVFFKKCFGNGCNKSNA